MVLLSFFDRKKFHRQRQNKIKGQSIVEVILGVLVVSLVLTAVAAGMTQSIRNTAESKFRNLATNYAQAGIEIFQRERNLLGWDRFYEATTTGTYCLNSLPADSEAYIALNSGLCASETVIAGTSFIREAEVDVLAADAIRVEIVVTWDDSGETRQVAVTQEFREF